MQEIQEMCQYEKFENILFLANSKDLIRYIKKLKVDGLYPNLQKEIPDEESKGESPEVNGVYSINILNQHRRGHSTSETRRQYDRHQRTFPQDQIHDCRVQ
jgi:hypothetical protein